MGLVNHVGSSSYMDAVAALPPRTGCDDRAALLAAAAIPSAACEQSACDAQSEDGRPAKQAKVAAASAAAVPKSKYRGVTKHKRSGRWDARIWVGGNVNRQIYLGGYDNEELAAEAHDLAALKTKGYSVRTNLSKDRYKGLQPLIDSCTMEELVSAVKRGSQGFSRGTSSYRGVSGSSPGHFEARLGVPGHKPIYFKNCATEEDAARVYDKAAVRLKGTKAATNFLSSDCERQLAEHHLKQLELNKPEVFQALVYYANCNQKQRCQAVPPTLSSCQVNPHPKHHHPQLEDSPESCLSPTSLHRYAAEAAVTAAVVAAASISTKVNEVKVNSSQIMDWIKTALPKIAAQLDSESNSRATTDPAHKCNNCNRVVTGPGDAIAAGCGGSVAGCNSRDVETPITCTAQSAHIEHILDEPQPVLACPEAGSSGFPCSCGDVYVPHFGEEKTSVSESLQKLLQGASGDAQDMRAVDPKVDGLPVHLCGSTGPYAPCYKATLMQQSGENEDAAVSVRSPRSKDAQAHDTRSLPVRIAGSNRRNEQGTPPVPVLPTARDLIVDSQLLPRDKELDADTRRWIQEGYPDEQFSALYSVLRRVQGRTV